MLNVASGVEPTVYCAVYAVVVHFEEHLHNVLAIHVSFFFGINHNLYLYVPIEI